MFDVLRGTPFHDDVINVLAKYEQRMNATERKEHSALGRQFAYVPDGGTKAYAGKEDVIDALLTGILSSPGSMNGDRTLALSIHPSWSQPLLRSWSARATNAPPAADIFVRTLRPA